MNKTLKNGDGAIIRFLLADDDIINHRIFEELIHTMGDSLDVVENGQRAVEQYLLKSYDVILLDISMPVMNGLDCAREIRRIEWIENIVAPVTIVGCTTNTSAEFHMICREAGMDGVMIKPPSVRKLETVIRIAMRHSKLRESSRV